MSLCVYERELVSVCVYEHLSTCVCERLSTCASVCNERLAACGFLRLSACVSLCVFVWLQLGCLFPLVSLTHLVVRVLRLSSI